MPTLTVYPDAHPETTSVDGLVERTVAVDESWATIHDSAGNAFNDKLTEAYLVWILAGPSNWKRMRRSPFLFDTSGLPNDCIIISATLSILGTAKLDSWGDSSVNVFASDPASDIALATGDYNVGGWGSTPLSAAITSPNWNTDGVTWNDFALNSTGLALISKTGRTKFGLREATYEAPNSAPTWGARYATYFRGYYADKGIVEGVDYRPKLVITYDFPGGEPGHIWTNNRQFFCIGESGLKRSFEGSDMGGDGEAGFAYVRGIYLHYLDQNGDMRRLQGTLTGNISGKEAGHIAVKNENIHFIDANGDERYAVVGSMINSPNQIFNGMGFN